MRSLIGILLATLSSFAFGQTKIDEILSVEFPGEVVRYDSVINGSRVSFFVSDLEFERFGLQRVVIDSIEKDMEKLPRTLGEVIRSYDDFENGVVESASKDGLILDKSTSFMIGDFLGREIVLKYKDDRSIGLVTRLLRLNQYFYSLLYVCGSSYNEDRRNAFLGSIEINTSSEKVLQIRDMGSSEDFYFKLGEYAFPVVALIVVGIVIYFSKKGKKTE